MENCIYPTMKVDELLTRFPKAKDILLQLSPAFAALNNPILRKTLAKITSLEQAARVANIPINTLMEHLKEHLGVSIQDAEPSAVVDIATFITNTPEGEKTIDMAMLLEQGLHPKEELLNYLEQMSKSEQLTILAPFIPKPLLEQLPKDLFSVEIQEDKPHHFRTTILKK